MHQLILGATVPLALAAVIYLALRCRASMALLLLTPPAMAVCGIWAILPDVPRLIGWHALYTRLAQSPRSDVFFWHYTIDQMEAAQLDAMTPLFNVVFALLVMLLLAAAWRELHLAEQERS